MIAQGLACATLPSSDLERSRRFYEQALGLTEHPHAPAGGVWYEAGRGTLLHVYETTAARGEHTAVTFLVQDFEQTIAELRTRNVDFEEYDLPGLKTDDGVWRASAGFSAAWIRDPDSNILAIASN
jgi:catechol 2,3-dioxygenase-like lactoylglutathione lyase family enzyme